MIQYEYGLSCRCRPIHLGRAIPRRERNLADAPRGRHAERGNCGGAPCTATGHNGGSLENRISSLPLARELTYTEGYRSGDVCERRRGRKKRAKRSGSRAVGGPQSGTGTAMRQQDITGRPREKAIRDKFISSLSLTRELTYTEGYRSGHNGAVLKTVRVKAHAGSNPAPSAIIAR